MLVSKFKEWAQPEQNEVVEEISTGMEDDSTDAETDSEPEEISDQRELWGKFGAPK